MKSWKTLLVTVIACCLVIPVAVCAVDEEPNAIEDVQPSFQNLAQLKHAESIAANSDYDEDTISDKAEADAQKAADAEAADIEAAAAAAAKEATDAEAVNIDAEAAAAAKEAADAEAATIEAAAAAAGEKAAEGIDDPDEYEQAYNSEYGIVYDSMYAEIYDPKYDEVYNNKYDEVYNNKYDEVYNDKYDEIFHRTYEDSFKNQLVELTGIRVAEIEMLRQKKMGWGQIAKYYDVHPKFIGLGHLKKMNALPEDDLPPADPEIIPLNAEIAEVTTRSKNNGWNKHQVLTKQKGNSKKWIGLTGTSVAAEDAVSETVGGKGKGNSGKSSASAGAGKSNNSNKSQTSLSTASEQSGKGKSKNNNAKSSRGSSNKEDRGNSGNKGNGNGNGNGNGKK